MTDTHPENPAVARRQLGFLETFDKKYEGFRRELERLERIAGSGSPPSGGWPTDGLERIARSLVGAGAVYSLPTITTWARGFLERLDAIRRSSEAPSASDFSFLAEQIRALVEIESRLTRTARMIVSPATVPAEQEAGERNEQPSESPQPFIAPAAATERRDSVPPRWTPRPPAPSKPPTARPSAPPGSRPSTPPPLPRPSTPPPLSRPSTPPPGPRVSTTPPPQAEDPAPPPTRPEEAPAALRVETPVPPPPKDATLKVLSNPPPAPPPAARISGIWSAPPAPPPADERLVSRAWQALAAVALLALGFSLWFNYRLFASFDERAPRAPEAAPTSREFLDPPVPPAPGPLPDINRLLDAGEDKPATTPDAAVAPARAEDASPPAPAESDGYRRADRDDDEPEREERRHRRKKKAAEGAEAESASGIPVHDAVPVKINLPAPAGENPYGD